DLTGITLPDASFDAVLLNHVLDCMPNDVAAVRELYRVLRPGGHVIAVIGFSGQAATFELPSQMTTGQVRRYGTQDLPQRFAPFAVELRDLTAGEPVAVRRRQ